MYFICSSLNKHVLILHQMWSTTMYYILEVWELSQITCAFFGIFWQRTYTCLLVYCSKNYILLTTYPPINANVICESSLSSSTESAVVITSFTSELVVEMGKVAKMWWLWINRWMQVWQPRGPKIESCLCSTYDKRTCKKHQFMLHTIFPWIVSSLE